MQQRAITHNSLGIRALGRREKVFSCLFLFVCLLLGGCGRLELLRTKELRQVQKEMREVKAEIAKLQASIGSGFSEQVANVKEQEQSLRRMKADIQALVSRLERQLSILEGRMEESAKRLETISRKTDRIDSREFIIKGGDAGAPGDSGNGVPRLIVKEKTEVDKLYRLAYEDFQRRKFDLARRGFQQLLKNYPKNELGDNAQYWVAECYYAQRDYEEASHGYEAAIQRNPDGTKVPAALFKLGISRGRLKDNKGMMKAWNELIKNHSGTDEARNAEHRLKKK